MFKFGSSSFHIENNDNQNENDKLNQALKELSKMYLEEKANRENLEKIIENNIIKEDVVKINKSVDEVKKEKTDEVKKERVNLEDEIDLEFCDKVVKKDKIVKKDKFEDRLIKLEKIGKRNNVDYLIKFSFIEKNISNNLLFSISDDFINIENVKIYITISRISDKKNYVTVSIENPIYRLYWKRILINNSFDILNIEAISNKDKIFILSGDKKVNEIKFNKDDFFNNMIYTQIVYE